MGLKDGYIKRGKYYHYCKRSQLSGGKPKWVSTKQSTLALAKLWVEKNIIKPQQERELGIFNVREIRFNEFVEEFYIPFSKESNAESTFHKNKSRLKTLCQEFGTYFLKEINYDIVCDYRLSRLKMNKKSQGRGTVSKATVNREMALLRRILNYAVKRRFLKETQVPEFEMFQEEKKIKNVLSLDEINKFLEICKKDSQLGYYEFFYLSTRTGARFSELKNLTWSDFDLARGTLTFMKTKNHDSRVLPMSETSVSVFDAYRRKVKSKYKGDKVFCGEKGVDLCFNYAKYYQKLILSGLPKITFHEFSRNSFITNCAYLNMTWEQVSEWTGHKSYAMFKHYKKVFVGKDKSLIEKLDTM